MKMTYKKPMIRSMILLMFVGLVIGVTSCRNGNESEPQYYLKAKINGQQKDFLKNAKFQADINTWQHLVLGGDQITQSSLDAGFDIEIWNEGGTLKTGIYTYQPNGDSTDPTDYSITCRYAIQQPNGTLVYNPYDTENFTFTITELSKEKGIRGTFSGTISSLDVPGQVWTVENGEVYLPYNVMVN